MRTNKRYEIIWPFLCLGIRQFPAHFVFVWFSINAFWLKQVHNCCNAFISALSCKTSIEAMFWLVFFCWFLCVSQWILNGILLSQNTEESDSLMIVQRVEQWIRINDLCVSVCFCILESSIAVILVFFHCSIDGAHSIFRFKHFSSLFRCTTQSNAIEIFSMCFFRFAEN